MHRVRNENVCSGLMARATLSAVGAPEEPAAIAAIVSQLRSGEWVDGPSHDKLAAELGITPQAVGSLRRQAGQRLAREQRAAADALEVDEQPVQPGAMAGPACGWPVAPGHPELRQFMDPEWAA